jgi:hypothetical protein
MRQLATVDRRKGELIVCSYSQTVPGFWIACDPFFRLPGDADDTQLATALLDALGSSRHNVSPPRKGVTPFDPILRSLKLTSYAQYMRGTLSVGVMRNSRQVIVTPKLNGGARTGFTEMLDQAETLNDPSALVMSQAVRRALARAV